MAQGRRFKMGLKTVLFVLGAICMGSLYQSCGPVGTADNSLSSASIPLGPTYKSISANIIVPKCANCHGSGFADYSAIKGYVNVANPAGSRLYTICENGSMPQYAPPLSPEELSTILEWITNGALNN